MAGMKSKRGILKLAFVGITALIVQACSVTPDPEAIGPYPQRYKEIVQEFAINSFYDPYSLRDVSITQPKRGHYLFQQGWIVCLRANAKNRMGGYVGIETIMILINRGEAITSAKDFAACSNPQLNYEPWPEMENL